MPEAKRRSISLTRDVTERPVRVGILGTGYISQAHLRALKSLPNLDIVAVCDVRRTRAAEVASAWHIPNYFGSVKDLLDAPLDVVHVLVPPAAHAQAAIACLRSGCDVFLEKPMGISAEECRRISHVASETGRRVGVNHNYTFHPAFLKLTSAIRDHSLGAIQHVTACVSVPLRQLTAGEHGHWMFQAPGNIILEQACHPLSQIYSLMGGADETTALATGEMMLNTGAVFYRNWQIALRCERGTGQCFFSFGAEYFDLWLHVLGQDGAAFLDFRRNTFSLAGKSRFLDPVDHLRQAWMQSVATVAGGTRNFVNYVAGFLKLKSACDPFSISIQNSIGSFYESRRRGLTVPVGPEAGLSVADTCMKIIEAASVKRPFERTEQYVHAEC